MKKLAIFLITLFSLESCGHTSQAQHENSPVDNFNVADLLYKFQFDMTFIYGEAFTNKAWH